jgi:hypothetical protein
MKIWLVTGPDPGRVESKRVPASSGWPHHLTITGWYFFASNQHDPSSTELEMFLLDKE